MEPLLGWGLNWAWVVSRRPEVNLLTK